jgi:hypothetical protein
MPVCGCCGAANPVEFRFCVECGARRCIPALVLSPQESSTLLQRELSNVPDAPPFVADDWEDGPTEVYFRYVTPSSVTAFAFEDTRVCARPRTPTRQYDRRRW